MKNLSMQNQEKAFQEPKNDSKYNLIRDLWCMYICEGAGQIK